MNERERVKDCILFKKTDRVPWHIGYTSELGARIMEELGLKEERYTVLGKNIYKFNSLDAYFGNHLAFIRNRAVNSVRETRSGFFEDEWGVVWDRRIDRDIGNPVNIVLDTPSLENLQLPDPNDENRYAHAAPIIDANSNRYILAKFSYSLFERAWALRGMENFMMDFIINPAFVHDLLEEITDFNIAVLDNLASFAIDGVYFGDDYGYQRGLMMSPAVWRRFIKPRLQRMYERAHSLGCDVFIHSCGNVREILEDLYRAGVNVFNPFQPEAIDIEETIGTFSGKLAFYGGMSIQHTLPFGSTGDVTDETQNRLELAKRFGGYIISPSHDMPPDIPLENILTMHSVLSTG
jgi:uroporphyrinogen decarboxylase